VHRAALKTSSCHAASHLIFVNLTQALVLDDSFGEVLELLHGNDQLPLHGFAHQPLCVPKHFRSRTAEQTLRGQLNNRRAFERRIFLEWMPRLRQVESDKQIPLPLYRVNASLAGCIMVILTKALKEDHCNDQMRIVVLARLHHFVTKRAHHLPRARLGQFHVGVLEPPKCRISNN
jgi:hypothetical protein